MRPGHTVTVLGYGNEPFLRIDRRSATVLKSPTAAAIGISGRRSSARSFVWHDARVRGLPPGIDRGRWTIPLVVDGRRTHLAGEIRRVPAPSLWPWLAVGAPFLVATALLLLLRRPRLLERAGIALGVLAAVVSIATAATFAFASNASSGRWVEAGNEVFFALVGLAVLVRGSRDARVTAAGALGLLGLVVALSKLPVFMHGVVLAALPDTAARAEVALTIWASAAATAVGLVLFADVLE